MRTRHRNPCACLDCEDERSAYRGPAPSELLRTAALGFPHELGEAVAYLVDGHEDGEVQEAARAAHVKLSRDGEHAAARALAAEMRRWWRSGCPTVPRAPGHTVPSVPRDSAGRRDTNPPALPGDSREAPTPEAGTR